MLVFLLRMLFLDILDSKNLNWIFFVSIAEYKILCPGGEGFRPNPITVILEGNSVSFTLKYVRFDFLGFMYNAEEILLFHFGRY